MSLPNGLTYAPPAQAAGRVHNWEDLSGEEPDYLVDTAAANKSLAQRVDNPFRWKTGTFGLPIGVSRNAMDRMVRESCDKFIAALDKQGWTLRSGLQLKGPFPYRNLGQGGAVLLDWREFRVQGLFAVRKLERTRIELPPGSVKQDPEHKRTINEAVRAS